MSSLGDGTELAQKYKDKALARKRGAGTHQPKFRGFSLGKTADNAKSATTENEDDASIKEIAATTIQVVETTEVQTIVLETTPNEPTISNSAAGLNERYQERFKARFRGAGAHQPDFRGFSLKPTTRSSERQEQRQSPESTEIEPTEAQELSSRRLTATNKHSEKANRNKATQDTRESHVAKKGELTKALKALSIKRADAIAVSSEESTPSSAGQRIKPVSAAGRDYTVSSTSKAPSNNRYTDTTQPIDIGSKTPNGKLTRSASRSSGYSPSFKIAWGKNSTVLTSESNQSPGTIVRRPTPPALDQRPVIEDTIDDIGVTDDFEYNDSIPSPTRDFSDRESDTSPQSSLTVQETSKIKRKPAPTPIPDTATRTLTRKSGSSPGKRRRLIQEEADENEDPLSVHQNQAIEKPKTDGHKKSVGDKQGPKSKQSNPGQQKKAKPVEKNEIASKSKKTKSGQDGAKSLRQTTLMQLTSKPVRKGDSTNTPATATRSQRAFDDSGSESDFDINPSKTNTRRSQKSNVSKKAEAVRKGTSEQTVKNYKQLQIHCLKFWGPSSAVSRPATVTNRATAKQLPVEGEVSTTHGNGTASTQKTVQSVLEIDDTPLTEMDVIAEAVRDVVDKFIDSIEDQAMAKEMLILRSDLETILIEQVDMLDDHTLLRASARKAAALKKELRVRLLETQRQRQRTREELKRVRANFEREERARRRLEETHKFLTDLDALRDHVVGSDDEDGEEDEAEDGDNIKTGLQSLIATVSSRCGSARTTTEDKNTQAGMLGTLEEFNRLLETMEKNLQSMPLVTHSQEVSSSRKSVIDDDDDFNDDAALDYFNI
ncbi:hypothetical protein BGX27_001816 [Mortierella sp. AM989]|nr:hypothetical protein BGX27_001816 [Mortierella sp. AM989]